MPSKRKIVKMTSYVTLRQYKALKKEARRGGVRMSELVREALDLLLPE